MRGRGFEGPRAGATGARAAQTRRLSLRARLYGSSARRSDPDLSMGRCSFPELSTPLHSNPDLSISSRGSPRAIARFRRTVPPSSRSVPNLSICQYSNPHLSTRPQTGHRPGWRIRADAASHMQGGPGFPERSSAKRTSRRKTGASRAERRQSLRTWRRTSCTRGPSCPRRSRRDRRAWACRSSGR